MYLQAQEQQGQRYYEVAPLTVTVSPGSTSRPQISFSTGNNNGQVYEMSPAGSLVRSSSDFSEAVRVIVTDPDLVSLSGYVFCM